MSDRVQESHECRSSAKREGDLGAAETSQPARMSADLMWLRSKHAYRWNQQGRPESANGGADEKEPGLWRGRVWWPQLAGSSGQQASLIGSSFAGDWGGERITTGCACLGEANPCKAAECSRAASSERIKTGKPAHPKGLVTYAAWLPWKTRWGL